MKKNSKFKIKIGKYSSQKYQIEKYHCKKCCKDFENEYENFLEKIQQRNSKKVDDYYKLEIFLDKFKNILRESFEILIFGYFSMILTMLYKVYDREMLCKCLYEISVVYKYGILSFMGVNSDV